MNKFSVSTLQHTSLYITVFVYLWIEIAISCVGDRQEAYTVLILMQINYNGLFIWLLSSKVPALSSTPCYLHLAINITRISAATGSLSFIFNQLSRRIYWNKEFRFTMFCYKLLLSTLIIFTSLCCLISF